MRKIKLYIATSLNGRIAEEDGSVAFLERIPNLEGEDYGYHDFFASIDSTIQGYSTYKQVIDWGIDFPYKGKKNYVITRKLELEDNADVSFIKEDHVKAIQDIKQQEGGDIWLIGGGQVNTLLLNAGLIDEIIIFTMPIILKGGIEVFEQIPNEKALKLLSCKAYPSGGIEKHYKVIN